MAPGGGEVLTIDEVDEYLRLSKSTVGEVAQEHRVPAQKVGRHGRFRRQAIIRRMESRPKGSWGEEGGAT
jgi:excisionase family DNA binding protein